MYRLVTPGIQVDEYKWPILSARPSVDSKELYSPPLKKRTVALLTYCGTGPRRSSAGEAGFKGARKATSYAAEAAAGKLAITAMRLGFRTVRLRVRGLGRGKQSAIKTLARTGLNVTQIDECTPIPHNGCRPPAKRRT